MRIDVYKRRFEDGETFVGPEITDGARAAFPAVSYGPQGDPVEFYIGHSSDFWKDAEELSPKSVNNLLPDFETRADLERRLQRLIDKKMSERV